MLQRLKRLIQEVFADTDQHYIMDSQPASLRQMRSIVDTVLGHGPAAYHYSVQDVIRILRNDGRVITVRV